MSLTGVCLLPLNAGSATLCAKLINHLSKRYPEQEHEKFQCEYRLFTDTSSHAPGADVQKRAFTHVLNLSHSPRQTFVRTTKPDQPDNGQTITLPVSSSDAFTGLMLTRMQALWNPRSALILDSGILLSLNEDRWILCVGEVRVAPRQQAAGTLRGVLIELCMRDPGSWTSGRTLSEEQVDEAQELFRNVLGRVFEGTGENFDNANFKVSMTQRRFQPENEGAKRETDWDLANMYMAVLKGQR